MPTNPEIPRPEPTKTQKAAASVARFTGRHTETVAYASGILTGAALALIAGLVR